MRQFFLFLLVLLLPGCVMQTRHADPSGLSSYDGVSAGFPGDAQYLATMASGELANRYPPGRTTLILASTKAVFGQELESALRQMGFAVSLHPSPEGVKVGYTLDVLRDESPPTTCYLQVGTSDGQTFGRVRTLSMASREEAAPVRVPSPSLESSTLTEVATPHFPSPGQPHPDRLMPGSGTGDRPSQEAADPPARNDGTPVRSKATAARIAKRNHVPVADFCRWNGVKPETVLEAGRSVHLREPVAESASPVKAEPGQQFTSRAAQQDRPVQATVPVSSPAPAPVLASARAPVPSPVQVPASAPAPAPSPGPVPGSAKDEPPTPAPGSTPTSAVHEALAELSPQSPAAEAPSIAPAVPAPTWSVNPGGLHAQLESWSFKAQYQLVWKAKHDFELETNANFSGDFVSAIKQLFAGLHRGGHALRVTVYQGNNVIEVAED